ncbi:MAG: glucose dehydrogenase [Chloroflexi bacterium]|nr:MAG: glucose dehydrogenase [Chloroflexota bacterium]
MKRVTLTRQWTVVETPGCWRRSLCRAGLFWLAASVLFLACSGPSDRDATPDASQTLDGSFPTATAQPTQPGGPTSTTTAPTAVPTGDPTATAASAPADTPVQASATTERTTAEPTDTTTAPSPTPAPPFDPNRVILRAELVGSGFVNPLLVTHANDGSGRIFVVEKVGTIRLLDGSLFLDIRDRVRSPAVPSYEQEQGLLGVAFHPRFAENGFIYVHYNGLDGNHVLSRFNLGANGLPDPNSEKVLLTQDQPEVNFNGGAVVFGPDGYLYLGLGTGGTAVELQYEAINLGSWLGKILRIDVDNGDPYAIPPDNPFVDVPGAKPEVWVYGLRNPYRFAFDSATGDLYIGGPGQFSWDWIDYHPAAGLGGQQFAWPEYEGAVCWESWNDVCDPAGLVLPVIVRPTYGNSNCAIIGGDVYRGAASPALQGAYLYGDFCSGRIWGAARDASGAWVTTELLQVPGALIGSFGVDGAGELYVTDIVNGTIYRLVGTPR